MRRITFIICFLLAVPVFAQQPTRTELENRKKQILDAIRETEDELAATKQNKNATIGQLRALQHKLSERQRLISTINDELGDIDNTIKSSSSEVTQLKQTLEFLKMRYAQSVRYSYETRSSYDMMAFLFSSSDFNDAIRRMKYLKKFRDYRKTQVEQIRITQAQIQHKIGVLNYQKAQKDELLTSQMQQKQELQKETDQTNQVVKDLKGREKELVANVERDKKAAKKLDKAISEIIRHEIEVARKEAEEEAKRKEAAERAAENAANNGRGSNVHVTTTVLPAPPGHANTSYPKRAPAAPVNLELTPEALALSNNFESNKGRLPWPVEKGYISEQFGTHPHPIAEKVMVENDGVSITSASNAAVRAVFDGTVTKVFSMGGNTWTVIISHGQFFTVYNGVVNVSVKKGQEVHTKQTIGTVGINDEGEPVVNFQIWKNVRNEPVKLDPNAWIAR
jgi:murein hydrolase activator